MDESQGKTTYIYLILKTLHQHTTITLEIKQSKFIAHLVPYQDFKLTLEQLKEEHPKARHFVTAFRFLNEHDQIVEGSSDDGEPKGTSGKPSLAVLAGQGCINVAVITVRYFGGTRLGTGGLVRAYGDATNRVIEAAHCFDYVKEYQRMYEVKYTNVSRVAYQIQQCHLNVVDKLFEQETVRFKLSGTKENLSQFEAQTLRLASVCEAIS